MIVREELPLVPCRPVPEITVEEEPLPNGASEEDEDTKGKPVPPEVVLRDMPVDSGVVESWIPPAELVE